MSALWGEMVTARTTHTGKQSINSAISQDVKPCRAQLLSIDICSVSGPPRFVTLIACISIQHAPGAQCKTESNWTMWRYAGRVGKGKGRLFIVQPDIVTPIQVNSSTDAIMTYSEYQLNDRGEIRHPCLTPLPILNQTVISDCRLLIFVPTS